LITEVRKEKGVFTEGDFAQAPFVVFWEVTRACALACRHCRAKAQPRRHPLELSTEEGFRLIDDIAGMGTYLLVLTGGDPLMRPDIFDFIAYGTEKGLRVSLAPTATALANHEALKKAREAGVARISISLDGSRPEVHDAFRGMSGSFNRTMGIISNLIELAIPFQINTTVTRLNMADLGELSRLVVSLGPQMWDLFFLVPTGRGKREDVLSPWQHEEVFQWLFRLSKKVPFDIKTTCGQHYRRVVLQEQEKEEGRPVAESIRRARGVNDGQGCCFVSHIGEVYPSGFLPLVSGNVREAPLSQVYRESQIFRDLRDPDKLKGKCGRCEFRAVCGGSRARAYAFTGDYLAAEPCCVYQPKGNGDEAVEEGRP